MTDEEKMLIRDLIRESGRVFEALDATIKGEPSDAVLMALGNLLMRVCELEMKMTPDQFHRFCLASSEDYRHKLEHLVL